jgi:hypothetical protein
MPWFEDGKDITVNSAGKSVASNRNAVYGKTVALKVVEPALLPI